MFDPVFVEKALVLDLGNSVGYQQEVSRAQGHLVSEQ